MLVIVALDQRPLYDYLSWGFSRAGNVRVILDRRRGQRRERARAHALERRGSDRRRQPGMSAELRARGFAIATPAVVLAVSAVAGRSFPDDSARSAGTRRPSSEDMPATTRTPSRWLAVVRRGDKETFGLLQRRFDEQGFVQPIWDRRIDERRTMRRAAALDRRGGERRCPPPDTWAALGFIFLPRDGGEQRQPAQPPRAESPDPVPIAADSQDSPLLDSAYEAPNPLLSRLMAKAVVLVSDPGGIFYACLPAGEPEHPVAWRCGHCETGVIVPSPEEFLPQLGSACSVCQAEVVRAEMGRSSWWRRLRRGLSLARPALRRQRGADRGTDSTWR